MRGIFHKGSTHSSLNPQPNSQKTGPTHPGSPQPSNQTHGMCRPGYKFYIHRLKECVHYWAVLGPIIFSSNQPPMHGCNNYASCGSLYHTDILHVIATRMYMIVTYM